MSILCLDVGNSHIYGGVFVDDVIDIRFRLSSKASTSDELGIFLKNVLRENGHDLQSIRQIGYCSVVPQLDYSLRSACVKYFSCEPFVLQAGTRTGLNIKYRNPAEVGADRIANAIAASHQFPHQNMIIIDFGTAITFCAVSDQKNYLGGVILPGVRLAVESLSNNTAKLPVVEIVKPEVTLGRSTTESIQSGVYYGVIGACRELLTRIKKEAFKDHPVLVLATGGFAGLFDSANLYDEHHPDLVLQGVKLAIEMNRPRA